MSDEYTLIVESPPIYTATIEVGQGPSGVGSDSRATHDQAVAASVWTITHALGKFPSVTVVDSSGSEVEGQIDYIDLTQIQLTFSAPFSGKAYLN